MGSTWAERLDGLRDRFVLRSLVAAGVAILAFVLLTLYGAAVLGLRITLPTLALLPFWTILVGLFLWMPWEWGGVVPREPLRHWHGYWEGVLVYGSLLTFVRYHGQYIASMVEILQEADGASGSSWLSLEKAEKLRALRDDVFGAALMAEVGLIPFLILGALLLLVWWLLR